MAVRLNTLPPPERGGASVKVVGCPRGNGPMCEGPNGTRKCGLSWGCAHDSLLAELAQARAEVKCFVCTDWMKQADQLRADLAQARQDRDDADRDVETLQAIVKRQDADLAQARAERDRLKRKLNAPWRLEITDTRNERDQLRAELEQARAETDDLVAKAWDAAKAGFDQLTQERDQARAEREVARDLWDDMSKKCDQLRAENQALRMVVEDEFAGHEAYVDNVPCEAGNFDGGSSRDCEHCQHARRLEILRVALDGQAQPRDEVTSSS